MSYPTSETQPLCRYCGKPIAKHTDTVWVREPGGYVSSVMTSVQGPLFSKAECQRTTNVTVVSVAYHDKHEMQRRGHARRNVWKFTTWDGESYIDLFFCGGTCRDRFAYLMAREGHCTSAYNREMGKR